MVAQVDFIACPNPKNIEAKYYYHTLFGLIKINYIDVNNSRSKVSMLSGQETWVNHSELNVLVASILPLEPNEFAVGQKFNYYQMNKQYPSTDTVYFRDEIGIVGRNSKLLIHWKNIYQVAGEIDQDDYPTIFNKQLLHRQVDVELYVDENCYFLIPEKNEYLCVNGISFTESSIRKSLYKQGYKVEKYK